MTAPSKPRMMRPSDLNLHPDASIVPEMPAEQYKPFREDVKTRGVRVPIEVMKGTTCVIEGRTRLKAAKEVHLAEVPVVEVDLNGESPKLYMLRSAYLRRQLTKAQTAALGVRLEKEIATEAKERQREAGRKGAEIAGRGRPKETDRGVAGLPHPEPKKVPAPKSREIAAKMVGTSPRSLSDAKKIEKDAPEVFAQMERGEITLPAAKRAAAPAKSPLADLKPSDFTTKAVPIPAPVTPVTGIVQDPIELLEETINWINERAEVIESVTPALAKGPKEVLQREAVRLRGRAVLLKHAIQKAKDTQWEKEKK